MRLVQLDDISMECIVDPECDSECGRTALGLLSTGSVQASTAHMEDSRLSTNAGGNQSVISGTSQHDDVLSPTNIHSDDWLALLDWDSDAQPRLF